MGRKGGGNYLWVEVVCYICPKTKSLNHEHAHFICHIHRPNRRRPLAARVRLRANPDGALRLTRRCDLPLPSHNAVRPIEAEAARLWTTVEVVPGGPRG